MVSYFTNYTYKMSSIVVSPHNLSSEAGKKVLELGGNAVDAAIATNIVQGVVAPETCGIGAPVRVSIWDQDAVGQYHWPRLYHRRGWRCAQRTADRLAP